MTTEKKIAALSILVGLIVPCISVGYVITPSDIDEILLFLLNVLFFWIGLLLSCVLYIRIRGFAVVGSAFAITAVHIYFACKIGSLGDTKAGALWWMYFAWCAVSFVASVFWVWTKPKIFTQSALWSFVLGAVTSLSGMFLLF